MSNGYVKVANKRYTTIRHDFCITFDQFANIKEADENDNLNIKGGGFNFTTLQEISEPKGENPSMIDVIGVITECQGPTQIQIKSTGEFRDKMTITLSDDTNISIGATIWGEGCKDAKYVEGCIIR